MTAAPDREPAPSLGHPGRQGFNRGIYDAGDRQLLRLRGRFRGLLLDLGCGGRHYAAFLGRHCERYVGVDWSHSLHGRRADVLADLNRPLPFADGVADTVVSFSVLEHLHSPQDLLAEAARILRPGGELVLQVPFMWHVHEAPHDYFRYTRHGLEHLLRRAGFEAVEVEATTGFWLMWTLKLNYQLLRFTRLPGGFGWIARGLLAPVFWLGQALATWLDRAWPASDGETAGYFATARKPA